MKKLILIVWCFTTLLASAQENFVFDASFQFKEGLAAVKQNDKWGFIDRTGKIYIPIQYEETRSFSEGLAWVKKLSKWGVINKNGKEVLPFKYEFGHDFNEGMARAEVNGKLGYVNNIGQEITDFTYDFWSNDFFEGYAVVSKEISRKYANGVINAKGEVVVPFRNVLYHKFSEGLSFFSDLKNDQYGIIDKEGNNIAILPDHLAFDGVFSNGLAKVVRKINIDNWNGIHHKGYVNKQGQEVISTNYQDTKDFSKDGLASVKLNDKWGAIDKKGKVVIPLKYEASFHFPENEELARVAKDYYYGYIDKEGNNIIHFEYEKAESFREGLAIVEKDYEKFVINTQGEKVFSLDEYDDNGSYFSEGLLPVQKNGKWGFIDKTGKPLEIKE